MRVFAYYERAMRGQRAIIGMWRKSWKAHGWDPVLLTRRDAKRSRDYERFLARVSAFPTMNVPRYEIACYLRWLAMGVHGGGLMTDYDVMNYGFTPADMREQMVEGKVNFWQRWALGVVHAGAAETQMLCDLFEHYEPDAEDFHHGQAHVADMTIINRNFEHPAFHWMNYVRNAGDEGWRQCALVHYPHVATGHRKAQFIRQNRPV